MKTRAYSVAYPVDLLAEFKTKSKSIGKSAAQMTREMALAFVENRLRIEGVMNETEKRLYGVS